MKVEHAAAARKQRTMRNVKSPKSVTIVNEFRRKELRTEVREIMKVLVATLLYNYCITVR
jgi:hypothetical protein